MAFLWGSKGASKSLKDTLSDYFELYKPSSLSDCSVGSWVCFHINAGCIALGLDRYGQSSTDFVGQIVEMGSPSKSSGLGDWSNWTIAFVNKKSNEVSFSKFDSRLFKAYTGEIPTLLKEFSEDKGIDSGSISSGSKVRARKHVKVESSSSSSLSSSSNSFCYPVLWLECERESGHSVIAGCYEGRSTCVSEHVPHYKLAVWTEQ